MLMRSLLVGLVLMGTTSMAADWASLSNDEILNEVASVHGDAGPWVVAGYRVGQRALSEWKLGRYSFQLSVVHHSPKKVQYSCLIDGVQAATGASVGKMNLAFQEVPLKEFSTHFHNRKTNQHLVIRLKPSFMKSILDVPYKDFKEASRRVLSLNDDEIFSVSIH